MANQELNWRNPKPRTKMQNARKRKDWLKIWHFGANFHLNEMVCFWGKWHRFMHFQKKKKQREEKRNSAVLDGTVPPSSSPGHATREDKFLFFFIYFFLSLPPTCSVRAKTRRHPPHDVVPEKPCPVSDTSIGHFCRRRGRARDMHPMHGQRWDKAGSTTLPLPL
jgi:hypothetical protein